MVCRLLSELLIKNAAGGTDSDISEYVKAVTQFSGIYWHLLALRNFMNLEALWGIDSWVPECLIAGGAWPGNSPLEPKGSSAAVGAQSNQHQPFWQLSLGICKL